MRVALCGWAAALMLPLGAAKAACQLGSAWPSGGPFAERYSSNAYLESLRKADAIGLAP